MNIYSEWPINLKRAPKKIVIRTGGHIKIFTTDQWSLCFCISRIKIKIYTWYHQIFQRSIYFARITTLFFEFAILRLRWIVINFLLFINISLFIQRILLSALEVWTTSDCLRFMRYVLYIINYLNIYIKRGQTGTYLMLSDIPMEKNFN